MLSLALMTAAAAAYQPKKTPVDPWVLDPSVEIPTLNVNLEDLRDAIETRKLIVEPGSSFEFTWRGSEQIYKMAHEDAYQACDFTNAEKLNAVKREFVGPYFTVDEYAAQYDVTEPAGSTVYFADKEQCVDGMHMRLIVSDNGLDHPPKIDTETELSVSDYDYYDDKRDRMSMTELLDRPNHSKYHYQDPGNSLDITWYPDEGFGPVYIMESFEAYEACDFTNAAELTTRTAKFPNPPGPEEYGRPDGLVATYTAPMEGVAGTKVYVAEKTSCDRGGKFFVIHRHQSLSGSNCVKEAKDCMWDDEGCNLIIDAVEETLMIPEKERCTKNFWCTMLYNCQGASDAFFTYAGLKPYVAPQVKPDCTSDKAAGRCRALAQRWYFDTASGECTSFGYGGCGGNGNNYKSLSECEATCATVSKSTDSSDNTEPVGVLAMNGEEACEGHDFDEDKCLEVGCCHWNWAAGCMSDVGTEVCHVESSGGDGGFGGALVMALVVSVLLFFCGTFITICICVTFCGTSILCFKAATSNNVKEEGQTIGV